MKPAIDRPVLPPSGRWTRSSWTRFPRAILHRGILALIGCPFCSSLAASWKLPARSSAPTPLVHSGSPMGHSTHIAAAFESYNGGTVKPQPRRNDNARPNRSASRGTAGLPP